jgi:hypothetical protein
VKEVEDGDAITCSGVRSRLWSAPGMVRDTSGIGKREPS